MARRTPLSRISGARPRQGIEPGSDQPEQNRFRIEPADACDMRHFGRPECMEPKLRKTAFQFPEQLFVKNDVELRVQPALQQELVATQSERLPNLGVVLFDRRDIRLVSSDGVYNGSYRTCIPKYKRW